MVKLQRRKISKRTVDSLSVEDKEVVFWDRELPGFGVRVYPSGAKVYIVQSRSGGKSRRITLGRHGVITPDQARRKAALAIARIKEGESPKLTPSELAADPAPARRGQLGSGGNTDALRHRVLSALVGRYDRYLMNDVHRAEYVQCLVAELLSPQWTPPWTRGHDRAAWDLDHVSGARMEIEQTAALLARHGAKTVRNQLPRVGIAPRKGYWTADGAWIGQAGRPADIYVFAWHGEEREQAVDHRAPEQWRFFVVPTKSLPTRRHSIGLQDLEMLSVDVGYEALAETVQETLARL